jgi:hypothetical protein
MKRRHREPIASLSPLVAEPPGMWDPVPPPPPPKLPRKKPKPKPDK